MKSLLSNLLLISLVNLARSQFGSLKLDAKPNEQSQLTPANIYSENSDSRTLKRIVSLVNTPTFQVENPDPPQYPENVKYTEDPGNAIYIVILPHFPNYVVKQDVIVKIGIFGASISVKDSGLFHNDAFFPDLTEDTLSSIVRGRDYQQTLRFFRGLKTVNNSRAEVELLEGNSYKVTIRIPKQDLKEERYLRKLNRYFSPAVNTYTTSDSAIQMVKEKIREPFVRKLRNDPISGLPEEVFSKGPDIPLNSSAPQSLESIVADFLGNGTTHSAEKMESEVKESTEEMIENLKSEEYTEKNMDAKMKKKQDETKKKSEEDMRSGAKKVEEMQRNIEDQTSNSENEQEYEYS